jgi:hypothetical protein
MAAAQRTPTTFDTAMFRSRKRPSGTSGDETRASMPRKSARSAADATSSPTVSAEAQPSSLPFTIA